MKRILLTFADLLSTLWRILPVGMRRRFFLGMFVLESRGDPTDGLRRLLALEDGLELVTNERAMAFGQGEHPKHRLTNYHAFFIDRIADGEAVLDVGCGYGAVARSIAWARPGSQVTGLDMNKGRLAQALASANPPNLTFVEGDATRALPGEGHGVVVLSNVLEHIEARVDFLKAVRTAVNPLRILIRVPLFERDWRMGLRRELGVDFRSDSDHKIEHTIMEFRAETEAAGLEITELSTLWGEIWAECRPAGPES